MFPGGEQTVEAVAQRYEQKIQCLCQHLQELQRQINGMHGDADRSRSKLTTVNREREELTRQLLQKEDTILCLKNQLEDLKCEKKEKERSSQRLLDCLQEKVTKFQELAAHKDSALLLCKNEVKTHMTALEDFKVTYNCELQQKENCIHALKEEQNRIFEDLRSRSEENSQLDQTILDLRTRLRQCCNQLHEAESKEDMLKEKVHQMECQAAKEKLDKLKDLEEMDKKLSQSYSDVTAAQNEVRKLQRCLDAKEQECQSLQEERANLSEELESERANCQCLREDAQVKEQDNKDICRLLQQKLKRVQELEEHVRAKEEELETCRCCVEELSARIRELRTSDSSPGGPDDGSALRDELKTWKDKVQTLDNELADKTKKLEWAVEEMDCLVIEVKRLNYQMEEAKKELCEKTSMIEDLETTMTNGQQDMECRMTRADDQLHKYEMDIREKTTLIADCEERCSKYQHALQDKESELDQLHQTMTRLNTQLSSLNAHTDQLEQERDRLQEMCKEKTGDCTELAQEVKHIRHQLKQKCEDCTELQSELTTTRRELDQIKAEADKTRQHLQDKDSECRILTEEKACLASRMSNMQCRLDTETSELTLQTSELRTRLEREIEQLKTCQLELTESNATLMQKLTVGQRQLGQMEKSYYQKMDALTRENVLLKNKLDDKDDQIQANKDCLTIKDSEIMRLKLRMCSMDRCNSSSTIFKTAPCSSTKVSTGSANMLQCQTCYPCTQTTCSSSCVSRSCCSQWKNLVSSKSGGTKEGKES